MNINIWDARTTVQCFSRPIDYQYNLLELKKAFKNQNNQTWKDWNKLIDSLQVEINKCPNKAEIWDELNTTLKTPLDLPETSPLNVIINQYLEETPDLCQLV